MDSTTPTERLDGAGASVSADVPVPDDGVSVEDQPTVQHAAAGGRVTSAKRSASAEDQPTAQHHAVAGEGEAPVTAAGRTGKATSGEVRPSMVAAIREQCPACGAALASDQRYCVECGERCGPTRVPLADGTGARARETAAAAHPPRRGIPLNSTLIAGVGTLLLAMGVGVLIGRSANGTSSKTPPVRIVTVAGGGGTASAPTTSTPSQTSAPSATTTTKASGSSAATAPKSASKAAAAPPAKTVKVGSPGTGRGYQKGHFTGHFFGSESEE